jgi:peptidoglycan hydrolase-like protein with peptidoglycan-binding domain
MARPKKKRSMTALSLTRIPLNAGAFLAAGIGRFGLWSLRRFMRAPLTITATAAALACVALAGANALYFQTERHPAPLFAAPPATQSRPVVLAPVTPQPRPAAVPATPRPATAAPAPLTSTPVETGAPIGNEEVFAVQEKLKALRLFEGKADGYYGPQTARAIRAFELQAGMKPQGALTRESIDAILRAPVEQPRPSALAPAAAPAPVVTPAPVVQMVERQAPPPVLAPLPQPRAEIVPAASIAPVAPQGFEPVARTPAPLVAASEPKEIVDLIGETMESAMAPAVDTIEALLTGSSSRAVTPVTPVTQPAPPALASLPAPVTALRPPAGMTPVAAPVQTATATPGTPTTDRDLVMKIQRGLASLGFLAGSIDGVAGEATGKAIRNFEVYYNYEVTGRVTPELVRLLIEAGAVL